MFVIAWIVVCLRTDKGPFSIDAQGEKDSFENILALYHRCGELLLGLASGSLVVLISSSAFKNGHLPWQFASPLFLLALTVIYVFLFMVLMTLNYEHYKHDHSSYTRFKYTRNQALGFASMSCFFVGYVWLIIVVTNGAGGSPLTC